MSRFSCSVPFPVSRVPCSVPLVPCLVSRVLSLSRPPVADACCSSRVCFCLFVCLWSLFGAVFCFWSLVFLFAFRVLRFIFVLIFGLILCFLFWCIFCIFVFPFFLCFVFLFLFCVLLFLFCCVFFVFAVFCVLCFVFHVFSPAFGGDTGAWTCVSETSSSSALPVGRSR